MCFKNVIFTILGLFLLTSQSMATDLSNFSAPIKEGAKRWALANQNYDNVDDYMALTFRPFNELNGGTQESAKDAYVSAHYDLEARKKNNPNIKSPEITIGDPYNYV